MPLPLRRLGVGVLAGAWLLSLGIAFFAHRGDDVGRLPGILQRFLLSLLREPVATAAGLAPTVTGLAMAALVVLAWFGLGDLLARLAPDATELLPLALATRCLSGAALWALVWFALGALHLYRGWIAVVALNVGVGLAVLAWARGQRPPPAASRIRASGRVAVAAIAAVLVLALATALAPPTGRDALFYHFAIPKAYVAAGGSVVVPDNMATFYPQGVEMQVVWGMLLGHLAGSRVAEVAAGVVVFAFAPLLVLVVYGWARERGVDPTWASLAALMVAAIPTVYEIAGSGYVDLALAAYAGLGVRALGRWWTTLDRAWIAPLAVAVGAALSIKLTAAFLLLSLAGLAIIRVVTAGAGNRRALAGAGALALGALIAAPWYLRTWLRTGSPLFPFYLSIWPGEAPGWDVARSRLYQALLSTYGESRTALDYLLAPVRLAVEAQPDVPARYDGVLGIAFLFALPLLGWAVYRGRLDVEARIAALMAGALFLFWLFSSQQLRFLLPALPGLAVAAAAAGMAVGETAASARLPSWLALGAAAAGLPVILAWFADAGPVRAALGGEARSAYLARRLDYYPYYDLINQSLPPTARVWLINMRRDTYHLERPYFSDFVFEDYTLTQYVRAAGSAADLRARVMAGGITHLLVRHDVLFDYARSPIVDDARSREQNVARLQLLADFFQDGTRLLRGDRKFWLIELPREGSR